MKTHKLESALGVSTWAKAYCGFCTISLAITLCVLLVDLSVLADLEGQVSLIAQGLSVHDNIGAVHR